jgi:hypothetical protein
MKITVPGTILATSLNVGAMVNDDLPQGAADFEFAGEAQQGGFVSSEPEISSVLDAEDEFYTSVQEVPVEIEWDRAAEKRFQALAIKEAMQTLSRSELVELEQLTIARRKDNASSVGAEEILEELRQWQMVNRVFEALDRYVQEIGIRRTVVTNRS